jgi:hypothetical protein
VLLSPGAEPFRPDDLAALWAAALAQPLAARRPAEWNAAWPRAALAEDWAAFWPAIWGPGGGRGGRKTAERRPREGQVEKNWGLRSRLPCP